MIGARRAAASRVVTRSVGSCRPGASRRTRIATTPYSASTSAVRTKGAAKPCAAASLTVVRALIAVPAHAGAEDADGRAAPARREPRVDERDADREGRPRDPEEEAADEQSGQRVVADQPEVQDGDDRGEGHGREHHPATEPVGQRADRDPAQRTHDHRHRDDQRLLERGQVQAVLELRPQRAEQRPRPEVHREADRRQGEHRPLGRASGRLRRSRRVRLLARHDSGPSVDVRPVRRTCPARGREPGRGTQDRPRRPNRTRDLGPRAPTQHDHRQCSSEWQNVRHRDVDVDGVEAHRGRGRAPAQGPRS